jgi:hypothetical protein
VAWVKWKEAHQLAKSLNELLPSASSAVPDDAERNYSGAAQTGPLRIHSWTVVHGFYVLMGGLAFDTGDLRPEKKFLPGSRDRLTLTPKVVKVVAEKEPSIIPEISEAEILDKSKANQFAKTLVCIQALWFCTQCFSRLATGLPISLLELNTLAHAFFALLAFLFWWNKPFDIDEPTLLRGERAYGIYAVMCLHNYFDNFYHLTVNEAGKEPCPVNYLPHAVGSPGHQMEQGVGRGTESEELKLYI